MTRDEAIAVGALGAKRIQTALEWFETNEPSDAITSLHNSLASMASAAESLIGVPAGTIRPADGGTQKPPA